MGTQNYPVSTTKPPVSTDGNVLLSLAIIGDSVVAALDSRNVADKSPVGALLAYAGQPFNITHFGGVGGENTAQIVARALAYLSSQCPDAVLFYMGTNDANQRPADSDATVATIVAGYRTCIDAARSKGVRYILVMSMFPFRATYALTAAQKAIMIRVNAQLRAYCRTVGACYLDLYSVISDATGLDALVSKMTDDFHPGNNGCIGFGKHNAPMLLKYIGRSGAPTFSTTQGGFTANANNRSLVPNPMSSGTGGVLSDGATGAVPDNLRVRKLSGGGASTCVSSIIPANVSGGRATRLTLASLADGEQWAVAAANGAQFNDPASGTPFATAGDRVYVEAVIKTTNAAAVLAGVSVWGRCTVTGGASAGQIPINAYAVTVATAQAMDQDVPALLFRSPVVTLPADAASIAFDGVWAQSVAKAAGGCSFEVEVLNILNIGKA